LAYFGNYEQFEGTIGWGRIHFNVPLRVLQAISGADFSYDASFYGMESGISGTAITQAAYDFGAAGPLLAGLFGILVTVLHRKAIVLPERWLPLHGYVCFSCLTLLVDNMLIGGLGSFATWSFLGYALLHYLLTLVAREQEESDFVGAPSDASSS
jgi:hypothetical protein